MPRAAKDAKVEAPGEIDKLREWLKSTYDGHDLPEPERWRALQRVRSGENKSRGVVDIFYCSHDEPPKTLTSRLDVARHLGLEAPKAAAPKRKAAAEEEDESDDDSRGAPAAAHTPADLSRLRQLRPEQLLEAALARRTPHASATAVKAAAARPPAKVAKLGGDVRPLPPPKAPPARAKPPLRAPSPGAPPPKAQTPPPAAAAKAAAPPAAPLYKRPVATSRAARPPGAAPAAEAAPARVTHACSLSCPLQCPGWVGLHTLVASRRNNAAA